MVRHRLAVSEQGQVDVTGVETSGQAGHFGPSRVWECLLEEPDSGLHCRGLNVVVNTSNPTL